MEYDEKEKRWCFWVGGFSRYGFVDGDSSSDTDEDDDEDKDEDKDEDEDEGLEKDVGNMMMGKVVEDNQSVGRKRSSGFGVIAAPDISESEDDEEMEEEEEGSEDADGFIARTESGVKGGVRTGMTMIDDDDDEEESEEEEKERTMRGMNNEVVGKGWSHGLRSQLGPELHRLHMEMFPDSRDIQNLNFSGKKEMMTKKEEEEEKRDKVNSGETVLWTDVTSATDFYMFFIFLFIILISTAICFGLSSSA